MLRSATKFCTAVLLSLLVTPCAHAQTGDFVDAVPWFSSPAGTGVLRGPANHPTVGQIGADQIGVDRSGDGLLDQIYDIPSEILFNSAGNTIQFRLSPTQDILYARRSNINGAAVCGGRLDSTLNYFHRLEVAPATSPVATSICLDGPISIGPVFFDDPPAVRRTAVIAAAPNAATGRQSVAWVDLMTNGYNVDGIHYTPNVQNSSNGIQFAPDGRAAFIDHGAGTAFRRFAMIDLCRSRIASASAVSIGSLNSGIARGEIVSGNGGDLLAELHLNGSSQPAALITLDDCNSIQPPTEFNLIVQKSGNGQGGVYSQPTGINCGVTCQKFFNDGTVVALSAQPDFGSSFDGWSGDCQGVNTNVSVTMDAARECVASFSQPQADVRAGLSATPSPATAGLELELTMSAINDGPDVANVFLELPAVAGLTLLSKDAAECTLSQNQMSCSFSGLPAGQTRTVSVGAEVDPDTRGSLDIVANASSFQFDPNPTDNSLTLVVPVIAIADLEVLLTGQPDPVPRGEVLALRVEVSNLGPSTATEVDIEYSLPAGLSLLDGAATDCRAANLTQGGTSTLNLLAAIDESVTPGSILSITAQVSSAETDPASNNNVAMLDVTVGSPSPPIAPTPFTRIIGYGDANPEGTTTLSQFSNATWRGEYIAFFATNQAAIPDYLQGLYLYRSGRLVTIADSNTLEPGTMTPFQFFQVWSARIDSSGQAAFDHVEERGCGLRPVLNPGQHGIFDYQVVATQGNQLALKTFNGFMGDALQVWDGSSLRLVIDELTPPTGYSSTLSFGNSVALHNGDVAFWGVASDGNSGIYLAHSGGGIEVIADLDTPIPGGAGTFAGFDQNADVIAMDSAGIVFRGFDSQGVAGDVGNRGIYFYDRQTGQLMKVADSQTPIPGGSGTFAYFGEAFPSTSTLNNPATENGTVVFFGSGDASNATGGGLYSWRAGVITPLVEQGDLIDGQIAQFFSASSRSLSNSRVVFSVGRGPSPGAANTVDVYTLKIDTDTIMANGFEDP